MFDILCSVLPDEGPVEADSRLRVPGSRLSDSDLREPDCPKGKDNEVGVQGKYSGTIYLLWWMKMSRYLKIYRLIFWTGYFAVLVAAFVPVAGALNKIRLGPEAFSIRLDHLLHFGAYFLICMYYLAGRKKGLSLFESRPLTKFVILVLFLAVVTETVQLWVPARAFNVFDLVANVAGVAAGWGAIRYFRG